LLSEDTDRFLRVVLLCRGDGVIRIHEQRDLGSRGELKQNLYSLGADRACDGADARDIAARVIVTRDQGEPDRVRTNGEDDRNPGCRRLDGTSRSDVAGGANDVDLERDELSCERRQPAVIALGPAILDPDILAVDKASPGGRAETPPR
jgi:hypothetical protein